MRALRTLVLSVVTVAAVLKVAQAKTNYAYVANYYQNTVSVINTSNNTVVKTIPVGTNPWAAAVNQAGTMAYVTNFGSNSVSVISTSTNAVVATIAVPSAPLGIALTPNGKTAFVGNSGSSVWVINTGTNTVTATVAVGSSPQNLAVTPNGTFVYVVNNGSGSVSVISTLTNAVVATIPVGSSPISLAISPDGSTAYVSNKGSNTVSVIQTANNTVINTINVASPGPWGAAVSPDGHWLYAAHTSTGTDGNLVTVIDTGTQTVSATVVVGTGPIYVAFAQDSAFAYVTNQGSDNVSVINTQSRTVAATVNVGSGDTGIAVMGTMKVSTVAGGYVGDGGPATNAALSSPFSTVQDKAGNYYVTDRHVHRIRKITPTGTISTVAGTGICGYNGDNIAAKSAMLCYPAGLAFDSAGNLYVADSGNQRVRKITAGKITTVAGSGVYGYSGDSGPATGAALRSPWAIALDAGGNLYFSEIANNIVRKVKPSGIISTYAGTGVAGFSGDGGPATAATMNFPRGIGFDASGNLYIADSSNARVRIVTAAGTINTLAGTGRGGCTGDGGLATAARLGSPRAISINNGILYVATGGCGRVRAVDLTSKIISTFVGSTPGYDGDNNPPLSSRFYGPNHTLFDSAGNTLIDDSFNGRLRKLSGGLISTFSGGYLGDGNPATSAALVLPEALAVDKSGNLYIADMTGNRVRKVSGGKISTIAGSSVNGYSGDGGPGTAALLYAPQGVAVDPTGNVFIADSLNNVIRKLGPTGKIATFASDPNFGFALLQMATDAANNLYVADQGSSVIWKITPAGVVSVFAGVLFNFGYNGDNISATSAWLNGPSGVAVDTHGNVLIADAFNSRVREVNTSGIISTIAGDGTCNYTGDGGSATSAELCYPWSIAVNSSDTIYIVDINYARVRKISGGIITAFAGSGASFNGDGLWPLLTGMGDPVAVALDSKGAVYLLDDIDHRVKKIQ